MHAIRLGVRENVLRDPSRITPDHYRIMLETRGRGWVYEKSGAIVAFGIADGRARNIWALFVVQGLERQGIGRVLLDAMVDWLFAQGNDPIWLTTDPYTRADRFYRAAGWLEVGLTDSGEIRFELQCPPRPSAH